MKNRSKLYIAKVQRDLFDNDEIVRLYVKHKNVMTLEEDLKEYLEVNYGLRNIYLHTYEASKEDVAIIERVATVICL